MANVRPRSTLREVIASYIHDRAAIKQWAPATVEKYERVLGTFAASAAKGCTDGEIQFESVAEPHIAEWLRDRMGHAHNGASDQAQNTMNSERIILKGFFSYAQQAGLMGRRANPAMGLVGKTAIQDDFLRIPGEEWPTMLDLCDRPRDRIYAATALYTLGRGSDLATRTIGHAKAYLSGSTEGLVIVRQKTRQKVQLPVVTELQDELEAWIKHYEKMARAQGLGALQDDWYLLCGLSQEMSFRNPSTGRYERSNRLHPTGTVQKWSPVAKEIVGRLGYPVSKEGGHTFRRSGALALLQELEARKAAGMLDSGMEPIYVVQFILGHSDVSTTWKYIGLEHRGRESFAVLNGKPWFQVTGPAKQAAPPVEEVETGVRHLRAI